MLLLPIGDEPNDHVRRPIVNWLLIGINLAVTVWLTTQGEVRAEEQLRRLGYVPDVADPATVLTHMFLHAGWGHVLGNMLFLWIFGDNVESRLGHLGYLAAYLATGVIALYAHVFFGIGAGDQPMVGASGAISGVQGLYFVACPGARVRLFFWFFVYLRTFLVPARALMLVWFALQDVLPVLLGSAEDHVAHWAHLGGFGAGLLLMLLLTPLLGKNEPPERLSVHQRYAQRRLTTRW